LSAIKMSKAATAFNGAITFVRKNFVLLFYYNIGILVFI
jgi:hypothetical protein